MLELNDIRSKEVGATRISEDLIQAISRIQRSPDQTSRDLWSGGRHKIDDNSAADHEFHTPRRETVNEDWAPSERRSPIQDITI